MKPQRPETETNKPSTQPRKEEQPRNNPNQPKPGYEPNKDKPRQR